MTDKVYIKPTQRPRFCARWADAILAIVQNFPLPVYIEFEGMEPATAATQLRDAIAGFCYYNHPCPGLDHEKLRSLKSKICVRITFRGTVVAGGYLETQKPMAKPNISRSTEIREFSLTLKHPFDESTIKAACYLLEKKLIKPVLIYHLPLEQVLPVIAPYDVELVTDTLDGYPILV